MASDTSSPMMSLLRGHSQTHMLLAQGEHSMTRAKSDNLNTYCRDERVRQSQQDLRARNTQQTGKNNPRALQPCQFNYKKDKMRFYQEQQQQQRQGVRKDKIFLRGNSQPQLPLRSQITEESLTRDNCVVGGNLSPQHGVRKKNIALLSGSQSQTRNKDKLIGELFYQERFPPRMSEHERDLMRTMSDNKIETSLGQSSARQRNYSRVGGKTDKGGSSSEQGLNNSPERTGLGRWWVGSWKQ